MDYKSKKIFEIMMDRGIIPKVGYFDITEDLLNASLTIYREAFPPKNPNRKQKKNEIDLSKKIAYLNFSSLIESRLEETSIKTKIKNNQYSGFVYVISNEAYNGYFKIGITRNIQKRLAQYQTYDPLKRFKIERYKFVENMREVEKTILEKYNVDAATGEWISVEDSKVIFEFF